MTWRWRSSAALGFATLLACASPPAQALFASCTTSASGVAFGTYPPFSASPTDSTGTVTVTCTPLLAGLLVSYTIALSTGSSGNYASRSMSSGVSTLQYQLYTDSARSTVWGDGSAGTATISDSYLLDLLVPKTRNYTVYGRIPALQPASPGAYGDTIMVTVTY
ncbi:MAG: spore coat protein U domain-containing protein [Stenotrophomonas sp.]|nr:spore coat U domain-containing protein [Stenotrophomonas sp.]MBD3828778.1 spore coat protein U domain-containing protein [Stenotrophomonas sp.]